MNLYWSREESQLLEDHISKEFIKNLLIKPHIRMMQHNDCIVDYQMARYGMDYNIGKFAFVFYHISFVNQFKRRIRLYMLDGELGRQLISQVIAKKVPYQFLVSQVVTNGRLIKSFIVNIKMRLRYEDL